MDAVIQKSTFMLRLTFSLQNTGVYKSTRDQQLKPFESLVQKMVTTTFETVNFHFILSDRISYDEPMTKIALTTGLVR